MTDAKDIATLQAAEPWSQSDIDRGYRYERGTKVYCCYGQYAEVGHSIDCARSIQPEGAAAIAGRPAEAKETAQRGAGSADIAAKRETATGAGDDAKPAVGAAVPNGLPDKAFQNLQAAAAMRGIVVEPLPGGGAYMVAQGVYSRECEDFAALAALMERMGVSA